MSIRCYVAGFKMLITVIGSRKRRIISAFSRVVALIMILPGSRRSRSNIGIEDNSVTSPIKRLIYSSVIPIGTHSRPMLMSKFVRFTLFNASCVRSGCNSGGKSNFGNRVIFFESGVILRSSVVKRLAKMEIVTPVLETIFRYFKDSGSIPKLIGTGVLTLSPDPLGNSVFVDQDLKASTCLSKVW